MNGSIEANVPNNDLKEAQPFTIDSQMSTGLRTCSWPGRSQIVTGPGVTYYLDGAHTVDSIQVN